MKYSEFQQILSGERLQRYLLACDNNTRKTMTLYRLNLNLSQEVFTLLSCFEVAVRNAIDRILTERLAERIGCEMPCLMEEYLMCPVVVTVPKS